MSGFIVTDFTPPPGYATGLAKRDFGAFPQGYNSKPFDLPEIPESEWEDRLQIQKAAKAQLSDIRRRGKNGGMIPSLDQNGKGFCWAHSAVACMLLQRAVQGEPFADLSAYAVACKIKNFRDAGGWSPQALDWIGVHGVPTSEFWPQRSMSRANDNPQTWANAAKHKVTEWMELEPRNKRQLVTCLLLNIPCTLDLNHWGHSVTAMDIVSFNPFRVKFWNSWSDSYGDKGEGILEGSKAIPDGSICPRVAMGG